MGPTTSSVVFNWSLNNQSPFIQHKTQLVSSNMPYCMAVPDKKEKKRLSQSAFTRNSYNNPQSPSNDTSGFAPITVLKECLFESFWKERSFSVDLLDHTILRLRKVSFSFLPKSYLFQWIHGTILQRIVSEINALNGKISELDGEAHFIGSTSLASLKSMSGGKYLHLTTLNTLFPFLDCSKDQGYLVNRLKELSRGGCLDEYRADSGSRSLTHPWKEHLPSDTNIILHLVCAYLDTRIPIQPECLAGQKFSQTCIIRSPDEKPMARSKYDCKIYQTAVNPAAFKVVSGPRIYSVPEGRKCIFHALLVFFYHYLKLDGHIRMISLGPKGLNLSWVFEQ
ncbi:hypothetical protein Ciccas_001481 [Cichlidogyrus casuarinus]|uniref:Transmembrane protein 209 n=1 Tax=Cichlidogyrus casuarinus TaxID=1844966 RepID=A0ABD2QK26_9PLAT